ncbi:dehydrogenase [Photobacterium aquae]|uniref:Dehydrogenase n=1 Tax=Photobacterium aquae TaxID=1195763 RepID=A0A0J1JM11_9GAMM|nr:molecular chaperone TorD family protein [Photobacterium aquae]KLV03192.1 dehydrogenase [Photobacterium aquae]
MQISQLEQQDLSVVLKLFGALFYYQPKDYAAANLDALLHSVDTPVAALNEVLARFSAEDLSMLQLEHDRLFSGIGEMPAPPWGSAYLDREAVLFGESTIVYRYFLQRCGFVLDSAQREPEDQIGLMLMVLGMLLESGREELARELLGEHLMTWFGFFNRRFAVAAAQTPYALLAEVTADVLGALCDHYHVVVPTKRDYLDAAL